MKIAIPILALFLCGCSMQRASYDPPHPNSPSGGYKTNAERDMSFFKSNSEHFDDYFLSNILEQSIFSKLLIDHATTAKREGDALGLLEKDSIATPLEKLQAFSKILPNGNNHLNIVWLSFFSRVYMEKKSSIYPLKFDFELYYVLPLRAENGGFQQIRINIDSAELKHRNRAGTIMLFNQFDSTKNSPTQVFDIALPGETPVKLQPGGFLVAVPYSVLDLNFPVYHPENRFIVVNSHAYNYERNLQVFFFHYFFCKSKKNWNGSSRVKFNQFIDSVSRSPYKGVNPYTQFVPKDSLQQAITDFMHIVLFAEYGCEAAPVFVAERKGNYRFKFYSKVKESNMEVVFDLRNIKIISIKLI